MKTSDIVLGRDYRLRYAPAGHYRVRAISWAHIHGLNGRTSKRLVVETRFQDTGHQMTGTDKQRITAAELAGPWDDRAETLTRQRQESQGTAVDALRKAFAAAGVQATITRKKHSDTVVTIEVRVADVEPLLRELESAP